MNVYLTEEEQVEQIKLWLKKYGFSIVLGVLVGFAIMYGWHYWQKSQAATNEQASQLYNQVLIKSYENNAPEATSVGNTLIESYPKTAYATMTSLLLADQAVKENKYDIAQQHLTWVIEHSSIKSLREIAKIRVARIQVEQNNLDKALALLDDVDDKTFNGLVDEVRGDIYLKMGKAKEAKAAYKKALEEDPSLQAARPVLVMKLNNVSEGE
jgi:predicted negative regulator of RcsB-dependent stress response